MDKPDALRLADSAHLGYRVGWQRQAAAELRRLHAENEQITKYADALNDRCVRDAERIGLLLKALKVVLDDLMYRDHARVIEVGRAAIAAVEGEKT